MPYSTSCLKNEIFEYVRQKFPSSDTSILDVGPGSGVYFDILSTYYKDIDCCEIWEPYIQRFKLNEKYRNVYLSDISNFDFDYYELIVMGDILEHLDIESALKTVNKLYSKCNELLVVVPFNCEQGIAQENPYEIHLQPDLNYETMRERYGKYLGLYLDAQPEQCNGYHIAVYKKL